jgi:hypothetical protein
VGIETYASPTIGIDRKSNLSLCFRESLPSTSIVHYRHGAKLADGIPDGIVSSAFLKFLLHQQVATPGDY